MQIDLFLISYIIVSRIIELVISKKNTSNLLKQGAIEYHPFHYKFIVFFHLIFILYFLLKSLNYDEIIYQWVILYFLVQFLRYRIISNLGKYWTTRIIVLKNKPLINKGFYKHLKHPNYIIVFFEVIIVCLAFNDLKALIVFTSLNSLLLSVRIFYENKANSTRKKKY